MCGSRSFYDFDAVSDKEMRHYPEDHCAGFANDAGFISRCVDISTCACIIMGRLGAMTHAIDESKRTRAGPAFGGGAFSLESWRIQSRRMDGDMKRRTRPQSPPEIHDGVSDIV